MLFGEDLRRSALRISKEYDIRLDPDKLFLVGVFPVSFRGRSDVSIAIGSVGAGGNPLIDGREFKRMKWSESPPADLAGNYELMVAKWHALREDTSFLKSSKIG